jgi:hypothetical protein
MMIACTIISCIGTVLRLNVSSIEIASQLVVNCSCLTMIQLILFRPRFLNRTRLKITLSSIFNQKIQSQISLDAFTFTFFNEMYHLKKDANIEDFCARLGVKQDVLSSFIFSEYYMKFIDLVNKNSVDYFVDLIKTKKYKNYTVEA